jgi:predicted short-subunit dehydrogenase-like oxidoreductase (DUF2520 family)
VVPTTKITHTEVERLLIIGPGRVGTTLALAAQQAGLRVCGALTNAQSLQAKEYPTPASARAHPFHAATHSLVHTWDDAPAVTSLLMQASLVLVCVPDREIISVAARLAEYSEMSARHCVVHTAGSLGIDALLPLQSRACMLGAMHPLQSFADPQVALGQLPLTYAGIESQASADGRVHALATQLGMHPFSLRADQRTAYHAAAVLASNALTALAYTAAQLLPEGVPPAALVPLMQGAVENVAKVGVPQALTGPVDRGDIATVTRHVTYLQSQHPEIAQVYQLLSRIMVTMATQKQTLTPRQVEALTTVLQNEGPWEVEDKWEESQ